MNPGIATECKFVSATDVRYANQLLVDARTSSARLRSERGFKLSIRLGLQDHEWNQKVISRLFLLTFFPLDLAQLNRFRGETSRTWASLVSVLCGKMRQDGGAIEKWNRPERGSVTVGIASGSSSASEG